MYYISNSTVFLYKFKIQYNKIKYKKCFDYTNGIFKKIALNEQTIFH